MNTITDKLEITARDGGKFTCYVAKPKEKATAAIIIVQEFLGITDWLRNNANWLAENGFMAVVPDLFWRMEPGVELNDKNEKDIAKAFDLYGRFDQAKGIYDLEDVMKKLRSTDGINKVGVLGYCLGGLMSFLMAARSDSDATVSYYGGGIDEKLGEADAIRKPIILHLAEEDKFITKDKQDKIKHALAGHPNATVYSYAGMDHAFCRVGGDHFDKANAEQANSRTLEFLKKTLA